MQYSYSVDKKFEIVTPWNVKIKRITSPVQSPPGEILPSLDKNSHQRIIPPLWDFPLGGFTF